jgi:hypothetical protein
MAGTLESLDTAHYGLAAHTCGTDYGLPGHGPTSSPIKSDPVDRQIYSGGHGRYRTAEEEGRRVPAVVSSFKFGFREMGPAQTGKVLLKINQDGGFDRPVTVEIGHTGPVPSSGPSC